MLIVENIGVYKGCSASELGLIFSLGFGIGFVIGLLFFGAGVGLLFGLVLAMSATFIGANILQGFKRNKPNHFFAKKKHILFHKTPEQYSPISISANKG